MSRRVILVRHGEDPPDDRVHVWLTMNGFEPVVLRPYAGDVLPADTNGIVGSVVYGGGFNVFDVADHPFLNEEYRWIDRCMADGVPLLGICMGAQQIAWRLGAKVGPVDANWHEFGYYEIAPTEAGRDILPAPLTVTQSHYHTFGVPPGGELLATGALFPNQAFRVGERTYGFQFHPEVTIEGFRRWQGAPWAMYGRPGAQTRAEQDELMARHDAAQAEWFYGFLGTLFGRPLEQTV